MLPTTHTQVCPPLLSSAATSLSNGEKGFQKGAQGLPLFICFVSYVLPTCHSHTLGHLFSSFLPLLSASSSVPLAIQTMMKMRNIFQKNWMKVRDKNSNSNSNKGDNSNDSNRGGDDNSKQPRQQQGVEEGVQQEQRGEEDREEEQQQRDQRGLHSHTYSCAHTIIVFASRSFSFSLRSCSFLFLSACHPLLLSFSSFFSFSSLLSPFLSPLSIFPPQWAKETQR